MKKQKKSRLVCALDASGCTDTPPDVLKWAREVGAVVKQKLSAPRTVYLWTYRRYGYEMLMCDFYDEHDNHYPLIFTSGFNHNFNLEEPAVPDLAEAVHMAGILVEALDAKVAEIGRRGNEVNPDTLSRPLRAGETNGRDAHR